MINLSHSFGEGLLARMTKDEARARTAFEAARAEQEKIVQAQPDYRAAALRPRLNRRCAWAERPGIGRRPPSDGAHAAGKRCQQRQSRPSIFRHHCSVAGDKELALQQLEAGLRAPAASLMLSYGALKLFPSGTRSAAIRASRKSSNRSRRKRDTNFTNCHQSEGDSRFDSCGFVKFVSKIVASLAPKDN